MTDGPDDEPTAAIEYSEVTDALCRSCGHPMYGVVLANQPDAQTHPAGSISAVRIVNIAQVKTGWVAQGEIAMEYCSLCGQAYEALAHYIPIECASFPCPNCGPGSKLTPEILNITESEMGYGFVAVLKCDACSRQRRLSKLLAGLAKITRVKIGPTGVEVEVNP